MDPGLSVSGRRVGQVAGAAMAVAGASAAASLGSGRNDTALVLLGGCAALGLSLCWVRRQRLPWAVNMLLVTLLAIVCVQAWRHDGLKDAAVLAMPGLLIYAGMLARSAVMPALLLAMFAFTGLLVAADVQGWRVTGRPGDPGQLVHVWGILGVTAFTVWLLTTDLRRALRALDAENQRVRDAAQRLHHQATHDSLTGLPNRALARERFARAMAAPGIGRIPCTTMILDLDHFKTINESIGHRAGDDLLCQVSRRLLEQVTQDTSVCRLGGDEFLLLVPGLSDGEAAAALARRVVELVSRPFAVDNMEICVSASLGLALSPADGADFDEVLKHVDIAMYRAKAQGGRSYRFFDPAMNAAIVDHTYLLSGMRQALREGEFELHYQPQCRLQDGATIGAEALIRWHHPELGMVSPARFIPVAERSGLIADIGAWVLERACRQAADWRRDGLADIVVSVNLSSAQLRRGDIEQVVLRALDAAGLPADRLELELTESMIVEDSRHVTDTLGQLVEMGVRLAIDDFGTGYSNLGYLKRFEVGRLKIDQSFVRRLTRDAHDKAIVSAIVQMATSLGLTAVAEGVEDGPTLEALRAMGCHEGQGFHWSRGLPAAEFADYLRRQQTSTAPA